MKKYLKLFCLVLVSILLLTGCSSTKEAISGDKFVEVANSFYYYPKDITSYYDYSETAKFYNDKDISMTFIVGKRAYDIEGVFLDEVKNIYEKSGYNVTESTTQAVVNTTTLSATKADITSGKNWQKVIITNADKFYCVSRIDDTYLEIEADISQKDNLIKFLDALGY